MDDSTPKKRWKSEPTVPSAFQVPPSRLGNDVAHKKRVQSVFFVLVKVADAKNAADMGDRPNVFRGIWRTRGCVPLVSLWLSFDANSPNFMKSQESAYYYWAPSTPLGIITSVAPSY